jgi:uncharacterized tellurite resistance protein B-like protein
MSVDANLLAVADILLGAAYADGTGDGSEILAVRDLLKEITGEDSLAPDLEKKVSTFSPKSLDLDKSAKTIKEAGKVTPRRMLELCATIRDADDEHDLAEDDYIKKVGKAFGLAESEFKDLTLDYDVEEVKAALASKPPPPPKK